MSAPHSGIDIETHIHFDGARELIPILPNLHRLTYKNTQKYPFATWRNHLDQIREWFGNPLKGDIVKKFSLTTGVLQDKDTLFLAAENFVEMSARRGYRYRETIIAPQYCTFKGLTEKEVLDELIAGIKAGEAKNPNIEVNLIPAVGREVSSDEAVRLVRVFAECDPSYTPMFTLVCDEAKHPPEKHIAMYREIEAVGRKKGCHVSEWVHNPDTQNGDLKRDLPQLIKNARTAIFELKINRAEHLRILAYDDKLIKTVIDRGIGVTMCPSSYLNTEAIADIKELMIDQLLDAGVLLSLHSDDDLFMESLDEMFHRCNLVYKFTHEQKQRLRVNAWRTRFGNRKPVPEDVVRQYPRLP